MANDRLPSCRRSDRPEQVSVDGRRSPDVRSKTAHRGIARRHLVRLKRGQPEAELELELHGLDAKAAHATLIDAIEEAYEQGVRCLHVIHGRGNRSDGEPVIKTRLPGWLQALPASELVMAFASALPDDGGAGATYVLLRRMRD